MRSLKGRLWYEKLVRRSRPRRYRTLFRLIHRRRTRRLLEIGVWDGAHAEQFIRLAQLRNRSGHPVEYFGFDLFEDLSEEMLKSELSKMPPSMAEVRRRLEATGAAVTLHKGNTRETLPRAAAAIGPVDFAFVDGGHSRETIASDWENLQPTVGPDTVVVFDDYYVDPPASLRDFGCQHLLDGLDRSAWDVEVLDPVDRFEKPEGTLRISVARVSRR